MRDKRDHRTWYVIEITAAGERQARQGTLEEYLRKSLDLDPDYPIFVPYTLVRSDDDTAIVHNVLQGYVFIQTGVDERRLREAVRESVALRALISSEVRNALVANTVPDEVVQDLKDKLHHMVSKDLKVGGTVEVSQGIYQKMTGVVQSMTEKDAQVLFSLRTLKAIVTIPRNSLLPRILE